MPINIKPSCNALLLKTEGILKYFAREQQN